jgi:outer membrane protein TolC
MKIRTAGVVLVALFALAHPARAEERAQTYTLDQAVADALATHPRLKSAELEETAADARVDEARRAELPSFGVSAQLNRSTGNTIPGAFFPQTGFVPIAGPTRGKTFDGGEWQSGASVWASWDVLAFSRQAAAIDQSLASRSEASAATNARRLDVAYRAADAFVALLEAQEAVRLAQVAVQRAEVLVTVTKTLADQNLRPGADASRAEAELAAARTQLARAEQAREVRRAELATAIGKTELRIEADPGVLVAPVDLGESAGASATPSPSHPDVVQANAAVTRTEEAERVVDAQYLPRVDLVAALWMRGSGLFDSPANGLVPDIPNWAAGAAVTWSILDIPTIRARARAASAVHGAAVARREETVVAIAGQLKSASAVLEGARRVAKQTAPTLAAARTAQEQAVARFRTGLAPVVDVADAQRVLAQAELEDVIARLEVRRALLLVGRASGDLGPFLARIRSGG